MTRLQFSFHFLVFAIGVSHGIQQVNQITKEVIEGQTAEYAARASFSRLLVPGTMALVTDLVGFGTLILLPIGMIQELSYYCFNWCCI